MARDGTSEKGRAPTRKGGAAKRTGSGGAPATRTTAAKPVARKPAAAMPLPAGGSGDCDVDAVTREQMVAEAAYYIAERRGFAGGGELDDWLAAEAAIDEQIEMVRRGGAGKGLF